MRPIPKGIKHFVVEIDLSGRRYDGPFMRDFSVPMRGLIQGRAAPADTWQKWLGYQALTFEALSSIEFFDEYQNFVQNFKRPDSDHPGWVVVAGGGRRKCPQFLGKSWKFTGSILVSPQPPQAAGAGEDYATTASQALRDHGQCSNPPSGIRFLTVLANLEPLATALGTVTVTVPVKGYLQTTFSHVRKWMKWLPTP